MPSTLRDVYGFNTEVRRQARTFLYKGICPKCRKERADHCDHICPMEWEDIVADLGIDLAGLDNAGWICSKCHVEKSNQEADLIETEEKIQHYQKWKSVHFTPKGRRRTMTEKTFQKRLKHIRKIELLKRQVRLARIAGNEDREAHLHRRKAAKRREARKKHR